MSHFTCPHCGKSHEGDPTDWGWTLPDVVWDIPETDRNQVAKFTSDLCRLDDRYFIRCLLPLAFSYREGYFGWGIWVEVGKEVFDTYLKVYEIDGSNEPRMHGWLANDIPGYYIPEPCTVEIQFGPCDSRPIVYLPMESAYQLAQDQRQGITAAQYHRILEAVGIK